MKKNIIYTAVIGAVISCFFAVQSCSKVEENLDVDLSQFAIDTYAQSDLDKWIEQTLTDPYNIELVYRFDRNLTYHDRNVSPIELERVKPSAEAILYTYLKVYEKVAGSTFIKTYTPKQFVLYGSPAYNTNGSITLGTAEGGRKVVLYEMNEINFNNPVQVRRKMRTIHHEFVHIINQIVAIPPEFEQITKADYYADWTNGTTNSEPISRSLGFISRYSRSEPGEDFAETIAHLIVEGQMWYDAYAKASGADAYEKLKKKETQAVDYYRRYFNVDFRALQQEFAKVAVERYNEPNHFSLGYWMRQGSPVASIMIDPLLQYNEKYSTSAPFNTVYQGVADGIAAVGNAGRRLDNIDFQFRANNQLEIVVTYTNTAGSTFLANFSYDYSINSNNEITFTKVAQRGTTGAYANANTVNSGLLPLQNYLTSNTFVVDWIHDDVEASDFMNLGGFYVKDDPANYVFGQIIK